MKRQTETARVEVMNCNDTVHYNAVDEVKKVGMINEDGDAGNGPR